MNQSDPAALAAADSIAVALTDPQTAWTTAPPTGGRAWPQSLGGGAAGIALLHIERALSGHGDWKTAHAWLSLATSGVVSAAPNAALFFGAPALAFLTHAAAGNSRRYQSAVARLDEASIAVTRTRLVAAHARIDRGEPPPMAEFDLIRGLTGLGAYHLRRHPRDPITTEVLSYLVRLTEPLPAQPELPPWWMQVSPSGEPTPDYPDGHGNVGVSHGISAVLALLSLALLHGLTVAGLQDAAERICAWTDRWRQDDEGGPWWPGLITVDQVQAGHVETRLRPQPSWCYGISGTARSQQLAGLALKDPARQQAAEKAMLAALGDSAQLDLLAEIGLCHGTAGLLQSVWRMAIDARSPALAAELPRLAARLTAQLHHPLPDPEFMDGAAGAALALHTAGTGTAPASGWDTCLLLA